MNQLKLNRTAHKSARSFRFCSTTCEWMTPPELTKRSIRQFKVEDDMRSVLSRNGEAMEATEKRRGESEGRAKSMPIILLQPLLVGVEDAAAILGISVASLDRRTQDGTIGPQSILLGGRKLYAVAELSAWVAAGCPGKEMWAEMKKLDRGA